jgi:hypothetical protein
MSVPPLPPRSRRMWQRQVRVPPSWRPTLPTDLPRAVFPRVLPSACPAAVGHGSRVPPCPNMSHEVLAHLQQRSIPHVRGQSTLGGGGIRTRVLRSFNRPSPSAAGKRLSGAASLPAVEPPRIQLSVPSGSLASLLGKPYLMASTFRPIGLRSGERRYLSSERELRLGVCFCFRLFNVVPETTARFSYIDDRSRSQSPPWFGLSS